ncbi:MAG TPA: hypothetical protein VE912_14655, partial [Bacteroidales bacterium]|nr:hypothetical protein [Bacteroidales bacterium]
MKIKVHKIRVFTIIAVILTIFVQYAKATDYQTFYLDSISNTNTIIYCTGDDSIRLIPPADFEVWSWMINEYQDTVYIDTLILPNGQEGFISCQAWNNVVDFYVYPFSVDAGEDITILCGGTAYLDQVSTNYSGTDSLTYLWQPTTALNDSTILNPTSMVTENTNYKITASFPGGCHTTDSISVTIQPMNSPDICIVGIDSTNKNMIIWNKPE